MSWCLLDLAFTAPRCKNDAFGMFYESGLIFNFRIVISEKVKEFIEKNHKFTDIHVDHIISNVIY